MTTSYTFVPAYYCSSGSDGGQCGWTHTVRFQRSEDDWLDVATWTDGDLISLSTDRRKAGAVLAHLTGRAPEPWVVDALVRRPRSSLTRLEVPELAEWLGRLAGQGSLPLW